MPLGNTLNPPMKLNIWCMCMDCTARLCAWRTPPIYQSMFKTLNGQRGVKRHNMNTIHLRSLVLRLPRNASQNLFSTAAAALNQSLIEGLCWVSSDESLWLFCPFIFNLINSFSEKDWLIHGTSAPTTLNVYKESLFSTVVHDAVSANACAGGE